MEASAFPQVIVAHTVSTAVFLASLCTNNLSDIDSRCAGMAASEPPPNLGLPRRGTERHGFVRISREPTPEARVHNPSVREHVPWSVVDGAASAGEIQGRREDRHHEDMDGGDEHHEGAGHADERPGAFRRTDCEHGQTTGLTPFLSS